MTALCGIKGERLLSLVCSIFRFGKGNEQLAKDANH